MDFKSPSTETSTVLTSLDDFAEYKLTYPHLFTDLTDVSKAFTNGTDLLLPSTTPDLYEILLPAQPAIVDAAGNQIHAARPAIPRYSFTAAQELTADSRRELATHTRDLEKRIQKLEDQRSQAMKRALSSVHKTILTTMTNYDAVRFNHCVNNHLIFAFLQLLEAAANQGSSANGTAALLTLLHPDLPESTTPDNIIRKYNDNGAKVDSLLCDPLRPGFITVAQLQVTAFINNLHPTRDKEFLYWFNATYPTGKTNDFPAVSLKWLQGKKSLTPDQILAANAEATAFTQSKFVADSEAYISKLVTQPHHHAPFIAALKSSTLKAPLTKAFAAIPVKVPKLEPTTSTSVPLASRLCTTSGTFQGCGKSFVPASDRHKFCPDCFTKHAPFFNAKANVAQVHRLPSPATEPPPAFIATQYSTAAVAALWDNADSVNLTPDTSLFHSLTDLGENHFNIGGIGSQVTATATGLLKCMPAGYNVAYYSPTATSTLFSLGNVAANGGCYYGDANGLSVYTGTLPTGHSAASDTVKLLHHSPLLPNMLSQISTEFLSTTRSAPVDPPIPLSFNHSHFLPECHLFHANPLGHYTPEDRLRAKEVGKLHLAQAHPSDTALATALDNGSIVHPLRLTSRDVAIWRILELNCDPCVAAKLHNPSYPSSTNSPADFVGSTLSIDLEELPIASMPSGFTHNILVVEEKTGTIASIPIADKTPPVIFAAIMQYIATDWTAYGHTVTALTSDPEPVLKALIPMFGARKIVHTLMPPGQHAQRLERHEQELINKETAVRASLPFYFPTYLDAFIKEGVAYAMSTIPNTATSPATPYELRTGHRFAQHVQHADIHIGSVCMVQEGADSIVTQSKRRKQRKQVMPVAELGVCLGYSKSTPGSYRFFLASGKIVDRRTFTLSTAIPFHFDRRQQPPHHPPELPSTPAPSPASPLLPSTPEPLLVLPPATPLVAPSSPMQPAVAHPSRDPTEQVFPIAHIISYTGNPKKINSLEFTCVNHNGSVRYYWLHQLRNSQPFKDFCVDHPELNHHLVSPPSALAAPQAALASLPLDSQIPTDLSSWTTVTRRKSRSTHSVPVAIPPSAAHLPRTSKTPLPSILEFDLYEAPEEDWDWPTQVSKPALVARTPDDMSWYNPNLSPTPTSYVTQTIPWSLDPEPLPENPQCTFQEALIKYPEYTMPAFDKEMDKYFGSLGVCDIHKPIAYHDIPTHALKQHQSLIVQPRFHASGGIRKVGVRCVTQGQHQPETSYHSLYAGTVATVTRFATAAAYTARAKANNTPLYHFSFDITGAFLQVPLTKDNSPVDCFIKFPANIPHACAGKWFQRYNSTYGSKNANALFADDLAGTFNTAEYFANPCDEKLFTRFNPLDTSDSCSVSVHVDDGEGWPTNLAYVQELHAALNRRYGEVEWHEEPIEQTGFSIARYNDGSVSYGMPGFIAKMLKELGASNLPYQATPSDPDLFDAPTDLTPVSVAHTRKIMGNLTYISPVFPSLKKELQYLATRQAPHPTQSDLNKMIKLLAYINSHQAEAQVRFSGTDTQVYVHCDASYAAHPDGRSHTGYYISIGAASGAIRSYSAKQSHCVADGAMAAEYVVLAQATKDALHISRLLHAAGFPQHQPVTVFEDNQAAIKLAEAPAITRHSEHIHVRYHLIRDYIANGSVQIEHVTTDNQPADLLTKSLPPGLTKIFGDRIQGTSQTPLHNLRPTQDVLGVGGSVRSTVV